MSDIMSCERFEEVLADYMDGGVRDTEREALDAHVAACIACATLVSDLRAIAAQAATLGPIDPPTSVWAGIESRIAAAVVPIASGAPRAGRSRRVVPLGYGIAAALAMMAVTSGITYVAMNRTPDAPAPATIVAQGTQPESTTTSAPTETFTAGSPAAARDVAPALASSGTRRAQVPATAVGARSERPNTSTVDDSEITSLQILLEERRNELDPKTVAALERSMQVIDGAIEEARAALAADPASRFLRGQLNGALDKKMQLLRTAAMLPSA